MLLLHCCWGSTTLCLSCTPADPRYRGLQGIVVRDTANTLQLITPEDRLVVVPKQVGGSRDSTAGIRRKAHCTCRDAPASHGGLAPAPPRMLRHDVAAPHPACTALQLCTWQFDADRRRVVTLLGPGLARRGSGGAAGSGATRPRTLREAIRGQQHASK